jgi:hypothetical protein
MREWLIIVLAAFLIIGMSFCINPVVHADDPPDGDPDMKIDVGISGGDVKVDISASGPAELNVEAKGPAQVSIDAGDEVKLNVEASDESQILIEGQGIDEPAGDQETGDDDPSGDLDNQSSNLDDYTSRLNPYVVIISAAFPVLGVLTFIIIGLL